MSTVSISVGSTLNGLNQLRSVQDLQLAELLDAEPANTLEGSSTAIVHKGLWHWGILGASGVGREELG